MDAIAHAFQEGGFGMYLIAGSSVFIIAVIISLWISSKSDIVSFSRIFDDNHEFLLKKGSTSHPAR